ncbi:MAG: PilW family protein [Planctomycetota bacterium]
MKNSGFSLLEVMIAMALLSMLSAGLYTFLLVSENALRENDSLAQLESETLTAIEKICNDLLKCTDNAASGWTLTPSSFAADIIDGYDYDTSSNTYGDTVAWSLAYSDGETNNGADDNGNNLVDEMTLTRSVNGVGVVVCDHVAEDGLTLSKNGKVITISLSLQGYVLQSNKTLTKTISPITVTLRN